VAKTFIEEVYLRVHVAALRKALGDGSAGSRYIVTVPGRGYRFVAAVKRLDEKNSPAEAEQSRNLPSSLARMIGRVEVVTALAEQLPCVAVNCLTSWSGGLDSNQSNREQSWNCMKRGASISL